MRWPPGRRVLIGAAAALVALVSVGALVAVLLINARPAPTVAVAGQVPDGAVTAAADVVSGTDERARAALSPALSDQLSSADAIAPPGSTLVLDPGTWGQLGNYASANGQLTVPGQAARQVWVGFVLAGGSWRVTAVETTP